MKAWYNIGGSICETSISCRLHNQHAHLDEWHAAAQRRHPAISLQEHEKISSGTFASYIRHLWEGASMAIELWRESSAKTGKKMTCALPAHASLPYCGNTFLFLQAFRLTEKSGDKAHPQFKPSAVAPPCMLTFTWTGRGER